MLTSSYLDVPTFQRGAPGVETASLVSGSASLAAAVSAGATSITVTSGTGFAAGLAWIFDGPSTESVTISSVNGATLTLAAGLGAAHSAGVNVASPGSAGSLGDVLVHASAWVEGYCGHGRPGSGSDPMLFALARSETLRLPSSHAMLDPSGVLTVRPMHFPVQSVSALTLDWGQGVTWSLDTTQTKIPSFGRSIDLPAPMPVNGSMPPMAWPPTWETLIRSRAGPLWVEISYTGGLTVGALPWDLVQGVTWIACHLLSVRENPTGAVERVLGKKTLTSRLRGDREETSVWLANARLALEPYRNRPV
jgi:hypothetical protein